MTGPTPTYTSDALRAAFASARGAVRVPEGEYTLDYPLRIPRPVGAVRGDGPRLSVLRAKPGVRLPWLLMGLSAEADVSPVTPAGLVYGDRGWFSLLDGNTNFDGADRLIVDVTLAVPTPPPGGQWPVWSYSGALHVYAPEDVPFRLTYTSDGTLQLSVGTTQGATRFESAAGALPFGEDVRLVAQFGDGYARVWVLRSSGPTLAIDREWGGTLVAPLWCDLTVGEVQLRLPEGGGWFRPQPGTVYRRAAAKQFVLYSPALPPFGLTPSDDLLGVYTRFELPDGCLFRGATAGLPTVFWWRHDPGDVPGHQVAVSDVGVFGGGVLLSNTHNWQVENVHAGDYGRYGVLAFRQCYGGRLESLSVGAVLVGVALAGNSALCTMADCHVEACPVGVAAEHLHITGGWVDNCKEAAVLMSGDNVKLTASGAEFGTEGSQARRGVVLANCSQASFTGCGFGFLGNPVPAVEFVRSSAGVFVGPTFGGDPATPAFLKFTDHDPLRPCRVVGEGRRWDAASAGVPLVAPADAGCVVVS